MRCVFIERASRAQQMRALSAKHPGHGGRAAGSGRARVGGPVGAGQTARGPVAPAAGRGL